MGVGLYGWVRGSEGGAVGVVSVYWSSAATGFEE